MGSVAPPKVFLTGATGYVGGDFLYLLSRSHPDWEVSVLIRNDEKAARLCTEYANLRVVKGDLDSFDIIEKVKNRSPTLIIPEPRITPERPCWVIHASGTASFIFQDIREKTFGIERTNIYDDWDSLHELLNLPDDAPHIQVERTILAAGCVDPQRVKTANVSPPTVYGPGRGCTKQSSIQIEFLIRAVHQHQKGILVGEGKNIWSQVHVQDLSEVFLALGEAAAAGGGAATWGDEGYYLAEQSEYVWGDVERSVARLAYEQGLIPSPAVEIL